MKKTAQYKAVSSKTVVAAHSDQWNSHFFKVFKESCIDEVKRIFSDSGALVFFFVVQLVYPIIYPVPFYHQLVRELPVGIVDFDNSNFSRQLIRMIDASEAIHVTERSQSLNDAKQKFYHNDIRGFVIIPKDFSKSVYKSERTAIAVYTDASYFLIHRQVLTGITQAVQTLSAGIELKSLWAKGISAPLAKSIRDPIPVESVPLYNYNGAYGSYLVPVVLIVILQQTLLIGIGMLGGTARERKQIHFLVTETKRRRSIMPVILGKAVPFFALYIVHVFYFFEILFRVYGYPQNTSFVAILVYFMPFLLSVIFLSFILSTFFRSRESSILFLLATSIPIALLSGFSWPTSSMPHWIQNISLLIPTTSGISGFIKLNMMGAGFRDVLSNWAILWFLTILYFFCAVFAFNRVLRNNHLH